jgi:hypothetical protein
MKIKNLVIAILVAAVFAAAAFGPAQAGSEMGRSVGNAVPGEPGIWRVHFYLLGEDGSGADWGQIVSGAAQGGGLGGHSSGR